MEVEFRFVGDDDSSKLSGNEVTIFRALNALHRAGHEVEIKERGCWRPLVRKAA